MGWRIESRVFDWPLIDRHHLVQPFILGRFCDLFARQHSQRGSCCWLHAGTALILSLFLFWDKKSASQHIHLDPLLVAEEGGPPSFTGSGMQRGCPERTCGLKENWGFADPAHSHDVHSGKGRGWPVGHRLARKSLVEPLFHFLTGDSVLTPPVHRGSHLPRQGIKLSSWMNTRSPN